MTVCKNFAVHARTAVTFAGVESTIYNGYVGVSPGTAITGQYDLQDPTSNQVLSDSSFADLAVSNHKDMMDLAPNATPKGVTLEMGGLEFTPGTYYVTTAINVAFGTDVTLNGENTVDAKFIFIAGTTLVTAADTTFILTGGAKAENIIWALGTAATLGARSVVEGSILAGTAITFGTGSTLNGCAIALSAVTFESSGTVGRPWMIPAAPSASPSTSLRPSTSIAPSSIPSPSPSTSLRPSSTPSSAPTTSMTPTTILSTTVCENFAVHAGTAVTFAGVKSTVYNGYVGASTGAAITGQYYNLQEPTGDSAAQVLGFAKTYTASAVSNHKDMMDLAPNATPKGDTLEMGGLVFTPGTYYVATAINVAYGTDVTLNGGADAKFIFIAGTTLVTGADTTFILTGGAKAENIFWALGTAATLGARSVVEGSILAGTAITFGAGSTLNGCAIALTAVTFESSGTVGPPWLAPSASPSTSLRPSTSIAPSSIPSPSPSTSLGPSSTPSSAPTTSMTPTTISSTTVCENFAVHARTTVTFAGVKSTVYNGYVGVSPGAAITGQYYDLQESTGDSAAQILAFANTYATSALSNHKYMMALAPSATPKGVTLEMGGLVFTPGTYYVTTAINVAYGTDVILNGNDETDATFIFIAGTTLVTGADTTFYLTGGATAKNVIWALGTAATLGARSVVQGAILAGTAITFGTNSTLNGCAIAQSAVTFESSGTVGRPWMTIAPSSVPSTSPSTSLRPSTSFAPSSIPSSIPTSSSMAPTALSDTSICGSFSVHAGTTITFAGVKSTIYNGYVGASTSAAITGQYDLQQDPNIFTVSAASSLANTYTASALSNHKHMMDLAPNATPKGVTLEMGGLVFTPGTYYVTTAINVALGTQVTLNGENTVDATFIFIAGTTLITGADTTFILTGGAKAKNIYWVLGTAATLGARSLIQGSILAGTAITLGTDSTLNGCAIALSAVTFESSGTVGRPWMMAAVPSASPSTSLRPSTSRAPSSIPSSTPTSTSMAPSALSDTSVCGKFAVHARTAVTFAALKSTIHNGYVGVSPGSSITGQYILDYPAAATANEVSAFANTFAGSAVSNHNDMMALSLAPTTTPRGVALEMGGLVFTPGTYYVATAINIAFGTQVTLNGENTVDATFIFIAGTTLVTAADITFNLTGGAEAKNIFWALGTAATLGAGSVVEGSILAGTAITFGAGSTLNGCAIAQSAVTFGSSGTVDLRGF
jgi:hypothetical protein